ncbi:hypothetical protein, partial [Streptomyces sp. MBT62]|uniref:hypothetical protein n=1 Tax=Streptomyces sp. MBT62 TaxID=2800410 RepID=UPI00190B439B
AGPSSGGRGGDGARQGDVAHDAGWTAVSDQMRMLEAAGQAEDDARAREARLQERMPEARRVLAETLPPVARAERDVFDAGAAADTAADELLLAERAVTDAAEVDRERRARVTELTTDLQGHTERAMAATRAAEELHEAVRTAEGELRAAQEAVQEAAEAAREAAERAARQVADSAAQGGSSARGEGNSASGGPGSPARSESRRNRARRALDQARTAAAAGDRAVETARHAVDDTRGRLGLAQGAARSAADALTRARELAATATATERTARAALTAATALHDRAVVARDAAQEALDALGLDITDALAEQARQAARQRHAQRDLGDVVALLEAQRAAAGDGTALLTTGSLAATPAAWPGRTPRPTPARSAARPTPARSGARPAPVRNGARPSAEPTEEPEREPEVEPQAAPQERELRPGGAGNEAGEEPGGIRHRAAVSRAQGPETFARSLAQLLTAPGTTASDT